MAVGTSEVAVRQEDYRADSVKPIEKRDFDESPDVVVHIAPRLSCWLGGLTLFFNLGLWQNPGHRLGQDQACQDEAEARGRKVWHQFFKRQKAARLDF